MRKIIGVMAIVVLSTLALVGCKKEKEEDVNSDTMTEVSASMEIQDDTVENSTETSDGITAPEGEGGGNEFLNDGETVKVKTVAILVSKDEYFYENAPITLEEIASMLEDVEGELVVEITDNNATHKAYDKLVDKLTELEVTFVEQ